MTDALHPLPRQVLPGTTDARSPADSDRELLGSACPPGDEPPRLGRTTREAGPGWCSAEPSAVPSSPSSRSSTSRPGPRTRSPRHLHLDLTVPDRGPLDVQHVRATDLGATPLLEGGDDPTPPLPAHAD